MSFLGDVADAIGIGTTGVPWSAVATAGAGALGFLGQEQTNATNVQLAQQASAQSAAEAQKQRDFQAAWGYEAENFNRAMAEKQMAYQSEMSGTAYQRAVQDMEKAGLNPMLAYSQGGASTPSGSSASISQPGGAMGQAFRPEIANPTAAGVQSAAQAASMQQTAANTDYLKAKELEASTAATKNVASAGQLDAQRDSIRQEMTSFETRLQKLGFERELASYGVARSEREIQMNWPGLLAEAARARELENRAHLLGLEVPEAVANAAAWSRLGETGKLGEFGTGLIGKSLGSAARARYLFQQR